MSITEAAIDLWPLVTDWTYNDDEGWYEWVEEEEKVIEDDVVYIEDELEIPTY